MFCRFQFATLLIVWTSCGSSLAQETNLRERLEREAPGKWKAYLEFARRLQGSVESTTIDRLAHDEMILHARTEFKQTQSAMLWLAQFTKPDPRGYCWVRNDRYAFELRRKQDSDDWALAGLDTDLRAAGGIGYIKTYLTEDAVRHLCPFGVDREWLPDWIKKPGFRTKRVRALESGLVRVDFSYTQDDNEKKQKKLWLRSGWFVLDPNQYWRVCEYDLSAVWPTKEEGTIRATDECWLNSSGYPILKTSIVRRQAIAKKGERTDVQARTERTVEEREPSPEEFTLSAFGLPEPMGVPIAAAGSRWYIWFGLSALACVVLAVLCRRAARYFREKQGLAAAAAKK